MRSHSREFAKQDLFCIVFIIMAGCAVYANSLHVPWYFDDIGNIVKNPQIRDLAASLRAFASPRGIGTATFAMNYYLHGLSLPGYHLVNIGIHLATSVTVFLILKRLLTDSRIFPFFGALVFALHPLQTQAVTYVVQRYASLAGLFFFLSLYFFIRARESIDAGSTFFTPRHLILYLLMICSGAAAVLTKENTVVLPLLILLYDRYFLAEKPGSWEKVSPYILPFLLAALFLAIRQILMPLLSGHSMKSVTATVGVFKVPDTSPFVYFVTQFTVIWKYIRLLILPFGQTLDYDLPLVNALLTLKNVIAGGGLLLLAILGVVIRKRFRLASFGIFWFFISLAVESSFIPLDAMFEHRLYIPMFGFVLVLLNIADKLPNRKSANIGLTIFCLLLAILTWQRNALWSDPIAFNEDNLRKAPNNTRIYANLAKLYIERGRLEEARHLLDTALAMNPYDKILLNYFGTLYDKLKNSDLAIEMYKKAIGLDPYFDDAYNNLGKLYELQERWPEAEACQRKAINANPNSFLSHYNLGVTLYKQGKKGPARDEFLVATRLKADDPDVWFNLAVVAMEMGDVSAAREIIPRLRRLDNAAADRLEKDLAASRQ